MRILRTLVVYFGAFPVLVIFANGTLFNRRDPVAIELARPWTYFFAIIFYLVYLLIWIEWFRERR